jgi:hypothetical protein
MANAKEVLNILALLDNKDVIDKLNEITGKADTAKEVMKGHFRG